MGEVIPSAVRVYMQEFGLTKDEAFLYWRIFVERGGMPENILKQIEEKRGA